MRAHKYFLGDVLRFVGIVRENQRPAENGGLEAGDQGRERGVVTSCGQ